MLAEAGFVRDRRCADALELLTGKQLADGGFPAEARRYKTSRQIEPGADVVDWGGTSKRASNP